MKSKRTLDRLILSCAAMENGDKHAAMKQLELATLEPDYESTLEYLDSLQSQSEVDEPEEGDDTEDEEEASILERKGGCNNV